MKLIHRNNEYATHQPVLIEAVRRTTGPVLELGSGAGSTPLLHHVCAGRTLYTVDHDQTWLDRYAEEMAADWHQFLRVDLVDLLDNPIIRDSTWDVVFIDHGDWASRAQCVRYFRTRATFVILHDSDYFASLLGRKISALIPHEAPGGTDFSEQFKYYREHYPPLPWPAPTGPPTLIGSNITSCDFDVDWEQAEI